MITLLDELAPEVRGPVVSMPPSSNALCPLEARDDGVKVGTELRNYLGGYYRWCTWDMTGEHCTAAEDIYVLARVPMGPLFMGYLLRVPGKESSTAIDLWIYDERRMQWLQPVELADSYGDAGDWYLAHSWLLDLDGNGYRDIVKRGKTGHMDRLLEDHTATQGLSAEGLAPQKPTRDGDLQRRFNFSTKCETVEPVTPD